MVVWWTIPDSYVAWEWRPDDAVIVDGRLVREDVEGCYLVPAATKAHPWPAPRRPIGQPLAEMAALFAMEANIRPTGMAVTWVRGAAAVQWDRRTDRWARLRVGTRHGHRCLYGGVDLTDAPVPGGLEEAGAIAPAILGSAWPRGPAG